MRHKNRKREREEISGMNEIEKRKVNPGSLVANIRFHYNEMQDENRVDVTTNAESDAIHIQVPSSDPIRCCCC